MARETDRKKKERKREIIRAEGWRERVGEIESSFYSETWPRRGPGSKLRYIFHNSFQIACDTA